MQLYIINTYICIYITLSKLVIIIIILTWFVAYMNKIWIEIVFILSVTHICQVLIFIFFLSGILYFLQFIYFFKMYLYSRYILFYSNIE